jgi:hypothetical protein
MHLIVAYEGRNRNFHRWFAICFCLWRLEGLSIVLQKCHVTRFTASEPSIVLQKCHMARLRPLVRLGDMAHIGNEMAYTWDALGRCLPYVSFTTRRVGAPELSVSPHIHGVAQFDCPAIQAPRTQMKLVYNTLANTFKIDQAHTGHGTRASHGTNTSNWFICRGSHSSLDCHLKLRSTAEALPELLSSTARIWSNIDKISWKS